MKYVNAMALSAADTASATGSAIDCSQIVSLSMHAYFADSTVNGTIKIQASNDECSVGYQPANFTPTNWVDVPNQSATITSGSSALLTIPNMTYRWVRAVFTRSSGGSSTVNVSFFGVCV